MFLFVDFEIKATELLLKSFSDADGAALKHNTGEQRSPSGEQRSPSPIAHRITDELSEYDNGKHKHYYCIILHVLSQR